MPPTPRAACGPERRRCTSTCATRLRALIEPGAEELAPALATVAAIEAVLDGAGVASPRLLHGVERTAWPLVKLAARRGYATRIGFEDTLLLPDSSRASDNAALVHAAVALIRGERRAGG